MKRTLAAFAVALTAFTASAQMVTNTVTYSALWYTNNPSPLFQLSLQQLNTGASYFGSVLSIEVGTFSTNIFDYQLENTGNAASYSLSATGDTIATNPGPQTVVVVHSGLQFSTNLAASDGTPGSGLDYAFYNDIVSTGSSNVLVTSGFNSLYFGAGTFQVDVRADVNSLLSAGGTYTASRFDDRSLGRVYVTYTYTLIPEPGVWGGLAAAAALALVVRARRRRAS